MLRRKMSTWLIILTVFLVGGGGVIASNYVSAQEILSGVQTAAKPKIDEQLAKDKIKKLLGDQTIDFKKVELVPPQGENHPLYLLDSNNGDTFRVDAINGEILSATFREGFQNINKKLELAEAKDIAEKFVKNHSSAFKAGKNMVAKEAKLIDRKSYKEYRFEWREQINDLDTPNMVVIQIDPETGAITGYQSAIFEEFSAISTPSIEKEKAIQIAKDHVNLTPSKINTKLQYGRDNQLIWVVELYNTKTLQDSNNQSFELKIVKWVTIDALSGEVVSVIDSH
ncbi:MAG: PepSY domain-containing protein [Bacillota bacterium]